MFRYIKDVSEGPATKNAEHATILRETDARAQAQFRKNVHVTIRSWLWRLPQQMVVIAHQDLLVGLHLCDEAVLLARTRIVSPTHCPVVVDPGELCENCPWNVV
jgi:hypothetical protein